MANDLISRLNGTNYDGRKVLVDFEMNHEILLEENKKLKNRYCLNIFGVDNKEELEKLLKEYDDQIQIEFEKE